MNIPLLILVVYFAVLGVISWYALRLQARGGNKMLNYLLAGQNLPTLLVAVMLAGLAIGGASTVGVAEHAYTAGLSAGWYNGAWGAGGIVAGLFLASKFRKMNLRTVPEMIGHMHGPAARLLGVVAQLLIMMTITSLQYVAGGAILAALLPEYFSLTTGMAVSALAFIGVTFIGGYWASGIANVLNIVIIYVGVVVALIAGFSQAGGVSAVVAALPAAPVGEAAPWFSPVSGIGWGLLMGWMAVMITMACTTQGIVQIAVAARNEKVAKRGFIIGGLLILPAGFLCSMFGVLARVQFPELEKAAMALPSIAASISPLIGGVFLAGLWAADVSTAVGLLMGCSTLIVEDVVKRLCPRLLTPKTELAVSRCCVLLVSLCSLGLAFGAVGILKTITSALALTTSFTLLIAADLYCPRICRKAAGFWTILASLVVWALWTWVPATRIGPHLVYLEWAVCLTVFALFAVFAKERANDLPQISVVSEVKAEKLAA